MVGKLALQRAGLGIEDNAGRTAKDWADERGQQDIVDLLAAAAQAGPPVSDSARD
jgi:ankyrin repeat protein